MPESRQFVWWEYICIWTIFILADTDLPGGFWGSWYILENSSDDLIFWCYKSWTLWDHCCMGHDTFRAWVGLIAVCMWLCQTHFWQVAFSNLFLHQFCVYWLEIKTLNSYICNFGACHIILWYSMFLGVRGWFPRSNNFCSWSMSLNKLKLCMHLPICVF